MKIAVVDVENLGDDLDFSPLKKIGNLAIYKNIKASAFVSSCADKDVIICNRSQFSKKTLQQLPKLKLIAITATGFNTVDLNYAKQRGIAVANVPSYSTHSVSQHTFACALNLLGNLPYYDNFVKRGSYSKSSASTNLNRPWRDLSTLQWGIIGLGTIGKNVARIAQTFGAKVVYYSTSGKNNNTKFVQSSLPSLLSSSDVISIHAPLNKNTENLLNKKNLSLLKNTAILLNMGRGKIVDETALATMVDKNLIAGVAIDVFEKEPIPKNNPLLQVKNKSKLLLTPHMAWASVQSRTKLINEVIKNVQAFVNGKKRNRVI